MRVEMDEAHGPAARGNRADVGLRDGVIPTEHHGEDGGVDHLAHRRLDRLVGTSRVGRDHWGVAEIDYP
jgi:hypothetical protein